MSAHILIVDGAPSASQDLLVASGGRRHGPNYGAALASQARDSVGDVKTYVLGAADGESLPQGMALSDFDGIAWTILLTDEGRGHPMYAGKPAVFDALCVHQDEVDRLPDGAIRLAGNGVSDVQAVSLHDGDRSFWGVQYHPEYDLLQIAAMFKRSAKRLVDRGLLPDMPTAETFAADLRALHDDPSRKDIAWRYGISADIIDPNRHRVEFANWLKVEVAPRMKAA